MPSDEVASERLAYLIGRMAMGDRAAFKDLYGLTHRYLFHVALRQLRDIQRAEDVIQEGYMEVWQKSSSYSAALSKPMAWLTTIVRRRAIDEYRRLAREGVQVPVAGPDADDAQAWDVAVQFSDSVRELFGSGVMERLERCFAELSADQRRAIHDIRVLGMTYEEAALLYRLPRQTVASWVRRGIERLSVCMGA